MLLSPKKKITTVVLARMKPELFSESGYEKKEDEGSVSDVELALETAGEKAIQAVTANDIQGFVGAIRSMFMIMESAEDSEEE